jgi:ATP-dependent Clp protease protease subunit
MGRSINDKNPVTGTASYEGVEFQQPQMNDGSRIISVQGEVSEHMIASVIVHMLHLAHINHSPIQLVVSTYGGSVDEMFSLYDTIKFLPCPVHTIGLGKVMSAGVLLLASGKKGFRGVGRSARIMLHPISGGMQGNVFQMENESNETKRQQQMMVDALLKETKMTKKVIDEIMNKGYDYYITPQEALKHGIVDKIIG